MNFTEACSILGVPADADDAAIRQRYRELVKQCPPERDPERFQRIRGAFELCSDRNIRARNRVLGPAPYRDLTDLRDDLRRQPRRPIGAAAWLEVLQR